MLVAPLFVTQSNKVIQFQHMRLDLQDVTEWYVWLLEINSNKFYVKFGVNEDWMIGEFEIYGVKGYFEFNVRVIKMIRNIVQNLTLLA